jgi:hypothetical protein
MRAVALLIQWIIIWLFFPSCRPCSISDEIVSTRDLEAATKSTSELDEV